MPVASAKNDSLAERDPDLKIFTSSTKCCGHEKFRPRRHHRLSELVEVLLSGIRIFQQYVTVTGLAVILAPAGRSALPKAPILVIWIIRIPLKPYGNHSLNQRSLRI